MNNNNEHYQLLEFLAGIVFLSILINLLLHLFGIDLTACIGGALHQLASLPHSDLPLGHGGTALAMALAPVGMIDVPSAEQDGLNMQDVSQEITKMNPDRYPLDTIMRNYAKKVRRVQSQVCKYYQRSAKPMMDRLDSNATGNGTSAAMPASSHTSDPTNDVDQLFVQVKTPKVWRKKDTLLMRGLTERADANGQPASTGTNTVSYDQMYYVSDKSGSVLQLTPIGGMKNETGQYVVPSFGSDTVMYRMGSAMSEKDAKTEPFAMLPASSVNYCQNFMCQIEMSTFEKMTKKEVPVTFSDQEADMLYNMRGEIESSYIWGEKFVMDNGSDRTYFTEGLSRQIKKVLTYGAGQGDTTLTATQYTAWLKSLFTGNDGSTERVLLAGSDLIAAIELLRENQKTISGNTNQETHLGVKCTSIVSTFGVLRVVHAPLFDEQGWSKKGIALDPEHIYKQVFQPMVAKDLDFKSCGEKNADAKMLQEVSCVVLRYPDCHAIIEPKA